MGGWWGWGGVLPLGTALRRSLCFLGPGWALLALVVLPRVRDRMAGLMREGGAPPPLSSALPSSSLEWMLLAAGALLLGVGFWLLTPSLLRADPDREDGPSPAGRATTRVLAWSLAGIAAILALAQLAPGEPTIADAKSHVGRAWLWVESLRQFSLPRWTDFWYGGFPGDLHYPPLSHVLAAAPSMLGLDPYESVKIVAWLSLVASAVGFAMLARTLHGSRSAAIIGGLVGVLAPPFHNSWLWQGRLPGLLLIGILPWVFLAVERLIRGRTGVRGAVELSLGIWLLALAHLGQARPALLLLGLFTALRLAATWKSERIRERTLLLAGGWLFGIVLIAPFVIPFVAEKPWVNYLAPPDPMRLMMPTFADVVRMFSFNPRGQGILGASLLVLAIVGLVRAERRRRAPGQVVERTAGAVEAIGPIGPIGPVAMAVMIVVPWAICETWGRGVDLLFLGGILAAPAAVALVRPPFFGLAVLLLLADLAPSQLFSTYSSSDQRKDRNRAYTLLEAGHQNGRMLELPATAAGVIQPNSWMFAPGRRLASLGGPFIQGATLDFRHWIPPIDTLAHSMRGAAEIDSGVVRLIAFHGVSSIIVVGPTKLLPPNSRGAGLEFDSALPGLRLPEASLVFALPETWPEAPPLSDVPLNASGLPRLLSRRLAREQLAWLRETAPTPILGVSARVLPNAMHLEIADAPGGQVRIARAAYPGTRVWIDDVDTEWKPAPLGGLLVALPAGDHEVRIETPISGLRRACEVVQLLLAGAAALVWMRGARGAGGARVARGGGRE